MTDRKEIARFWYDCVQIDREEIFGNHDAQYRPLHLLDDANTMFAGYIGRQYANGAGVLLLGINPGGGTDAYTRTREDGQLYPLLTAFKEAADEEILEAFERVNDAFEAVVTHWSIWRIMKPVLSAAGIGLDESAFMNLVPYRTRDDKRPPMVAQRIAMKRIFKPTVDLLAPREIVALGKRAGSVKEIWKSDIPFHCVRRTRGDSYIHPEARETLDEIRRTRT